MTWEEQKKCYKCGRVLPLSCFGPNRSRAGGLQAQCRECHRLICRESDKKHQGRKITRRRNEPILEAVRSRLRRAVRTGEIIKPLRCEKCGVEEELHGHHADYTKPLEVTWLCARCHRQAHPERSDALDTLFSRAEVAEADNRDLDAAIDGLIADRDYFEGVAKRARESEHAYAIACYDRKKLLIENGKLAARVEEAHEALLLMIAALRTQARLALQMGGEIAVWEGNSKAYDTARIALHPTKEEEG